MNNKLSVGQQLGRNTAYSKTMAGHKEEVVISGIGGSFPECDNVDELKEMLFNKTNGVTIDTRRWNISIGMICCTCCYPTCI